ncbi:MAG: trypsin-like peptidase domain-containing protein [Pseudonocardia sp.]
MVVRREVEVYAEWRAHPPDRKRWECGSGHLLSGRLVLTAAHVVCPAGQALSTVQVRAQSGRLVDAAVVRHRNEGDVDVAVLVISDPDWVTGMMTMELGAKENAVS